MDLETWPRKIFYLIHIPFSQFVTGVKSQTFLKDLTGMVKKIKEQRFFFLFAWRGGGGLGVRGSVSSGSYCCENLKRDRGGEEG
jgi:hypothetical protein